MRIAAIIFTVLGIIADFLCFGVLVGVIGMAFGIWALVSLAQRKKSTVCGVFDLICTGLLGGIFYLCWDGN